MIIFFNNIFTNEIISFPQIYSAQFKTLYPDAINFTNENESDYKIIAAQIINVKYEINSSVATLLQKY